MTTTLALLWMPSASAEPLLTPGPVYTGASSLELFGASVAGVGDLDGDGYDDLAIGASGVDLPDSSEGAIYLYRGSWFGPSAAPDVVLEGDQAGAVLGTDVAPAGDVNGDGFADLVAGATLFDAPEADEGSAFVWYGAPVGLVGAVPTRLDHDQLYGNVVAVGGADVNGDGLDDVLFSTPYWVDGNSEVGMLQVHHGSVAGVLPSPARRVVGALAWGDHFGWSIAGLGDVDGDGDDEVAVGQPRYTVGEANEGAVHLYLGDPGGLVTTAALTLESNVAYAELGGGVGSVAGADVNGDGYADLIAGAWSWEGGLSVQGAVFVHHGSYLGLSATPDVVVSGTAAEGQLGWTVAGLGDLNGDGYDEIAAGAPGSFPLFGEVHVFAGSAAGVVPLPIQVLTGEVSAGNSFANRVASVGDLDGNGVPDLAITDPHADVPAATAGEVQLWMGVDCPAPIVVHPDVDGDGFGDAHAPIPVCDLPALPGWVEDGTDCDDLRYDVNPDVPEACDNGIDDDCDEVVDLDAEGGTTVWFDADGDGWGDPENVRTVCDPLAGYVEQGGDCDDQDPRYNPGASDRERCDDPEDYDCDGLVSFVDADGDGHGACAECDDGNAAVFPGAPEVCNGVDDDCDGASDAGDDDLPACDAEGAGGGAGGGCGCAAGAGGGGWTAGLLGLLLVGRRRGTGRSERVG